MARAAPPARKPFGRWAKHGIAPDMLTKDWNEKLAQALEQRISGGGKEIDFMLTPKSLGRLRVSMSMIEGQLSLAIKTDTAMAAAMLGDAESQLVQMLEARDLRVASFAASTPVSRDNKMTAHRREIRLPMAKADAKMKMILTRLNKFPH